MSDCASVGSERLGGAADCVPETRFGVWFQDTSIWFRHVLLEGFAELERLLARPGECFARILDVGCGRGRAFRMLEDRFRPDFIVGIDADPRAIEHAVREAAGCSCRIEPRVADVTGLELPDASMDLVFCHQTLHHVRNQVGALGELHRVLVPGGVLLLAESCRPFIESARVRMLFRHPPDAQHSAEEYLALLRSAGFEFQAHGTSTPDPWWARRDFGLRERLGLRSSSSAPGPGQLCVAATRPVRSYSP
jgi:SAM-dependent methyltransferase